jgi:predicted kinase
MDGGRSGWPSASCTVYRGRLLLLTGPAGVGKSTTARAWAAARSGRIAVSHDDVRYGLTGEPDSDRWQIAMRMCADAARRGVAAGQDVVIDAYLTGDDGPLAMGGWHNVLRGMDYCVVVLFADLAVVRARNAQRDGAMRLSSEMLAANYTDARSWLDTAFPVVDTTDLDIAAAVAALDRLFAPRVTIEVVDS